MKAPNSIRRQVLAAITAVMEDAMANGDDPHVAAARTFPGTPEEVLFSAYLDAKDPRTEAWWRQVEATVDIRALQVALAGPRHEADPAGPRDEHLDAAFAALTVAEAGAS